MRNVEVTSRLTAVDPKDAAKEAHAIMCRHIDRLSAAIHGDAKREAARPMNGIVTDMTNLVEWTIHGTKGDKRVALSFLHRLVDAVYLRAIDQVSLAKDRDLPASMRAHVDERTPLGVVVAAALAREKLENDEPVPTPQLAALSGMSRTVVRTMIQQGILRRSAKRPAGCRAIDAPILRVDAVKWLASRGIQVT